MNTICILKNPIQEYTWGSKTAIQHLIGEPDSTKPMAEMWMGAHSNAASQVHVDGEWHSLDGLIKKDPQSILGKKVAEKFFNNLPFLFKLLAAEQPLSLQVHPNLEKARQGFKKENDLGIPLNAFNRNYKDENHKPEILCALEPFQGLKGFRAIEEIIGLVSKLSLSTLSHELDLLKKKPDRQGLKHFFSSLLRMDKTRQHEVAGEATGSAKRFINEDRTFYWVVELNREYPGDIGVLLPVLLNLVQMEPGEAIFLPAGELHSYLRGVGVELMANSDNVIRGGLTPKHIDLPELLKIINFKTGPVNKVEQVTVGTCQTIYGTPAREFLLSAVSVSDGNFFTSSVDRSVEILICVSGEANIEDLGCGKVIPVRRGNSVIVPSKVAQYLIDGNATFYMASVPL